MNLINEVINGDWQKKLEIPDFKEIGYLNEENLDKIESLLPLIERV